MQNVFIYMALLNEVDDNVRNHLLLLDNDNSTKTS